MACLLPPAIAALLALGGCTDSQSSRPVPAFYVDLAKAGAQLDPATTSTIINGYRGNLGLAALQWDAGLARQAEDEAGRFAARGEVTSAGLPASRQAKGLHRSVSGGYHSFADAFSGWRGSPVHDAVLKAPKGKRYGIGVVARPESRHRVYWVVLVSDQ